MANAPVSFPSAGGNNGNSATANGGPAQSNGQDSTSPQGNTPNPNSPSSQNVNPLSNSQTDRQTNALAGLAEMLRLGQTGNNGNDSNNGGNNGNLDPNLGRRGATHVGGANDGSQNNNQQHQPNQQRQQQTGPSGDADANHMTNAIQQLMRPYRGEALHQYDVEAISNGLRDGDIEPLTGQIDAAIAAGINRSLEVILQQIAPGLIDAAVSRSVSQASESITVSNVWSSAVEEYPQLAEAENLVRPQLEQAFRNTGDKKKAIEAIIAVYGQSAGLQRQPNAMEQLTAPRDAFNIDSFLGGGN